MKFSLACLIGASTASALVLHEAPNDRLTWTGEVIPGAQPVSFSGDARSIYEQIKEANPNYERDFPVKRESDTSQSFGQHLKRSNPNPVSTDFTCAYGTLVDVTPIDVGIRSLYNIASGTCNAPAGAPGAGGCTRLTCSSNASIWLCNDNAFAVEIPCNLIADNAVELLIQCQTTTYAGGNTWSSTVRGQIFASDHSWNVIIDQNTC